MARNSSKTTIWNLDPAHSGVHFTVRHMMFAKVRGRFAKFSGRLAFEGDDFASAQVEGDVDVASIDTGVSDRDNHLRSADFFDVERFPTITFRSRSIEKVGDGGAEPRFRVVGDLTIRDVTHEVVLDAVFGGRAKDPWGNERVAFHATTSLDRKDFGLTWNQLLEAGGVLVGDRVDVELEIQAVQAAAEEPTRAQA